MPKATRIKILQKIDHAAFKRLYDQVRGQGVMVVTDKNPSIEFLKAEDFIGKVKAVFHIGKKLEIETDPPLSGNNYRVCESGGIFRLIQNGADFN